MRTTRDGRYNYFVLQLNGREVKSLGYTDTEACQLQEIAQHTTESGSLVPPSEPPLGKSAIRVYSKILQDAMEMKR